MRATQAKKPRPRGGRLAYIKTPLRIDAKIEARRVFLITFLTVLVL
jgi:hypothetical protein